MVMTGEFDDEGVTPQGLELAGSDLPVISIETHPPGERQMEPNEEGSECPADHSEAGMSLADVVEQRGFDRDSILDPGLDHGGGRVEAVTLIGHGLGQEHVGQLRR